MFLFPLTAEMENHLKSKLFERTKHSLCLKTTLHLLLYSILHSSKTPGWKRNLTIFPVVKGQPVVLDYSGAESSNKRETLWVGCRSEHTSQPEGGQELTASCLSAGGLLCLQPPERQSGPFGHSKPPRVSVSYTAVPQAYAF